MDLPTFFLGLLKEQTALFSAIAWPFAVVWIAYLFRKEVRVLIGRIASIKSSFASVELKEEIEQTQAAVTQAVINSDAEPQATPPVGLNASTSVAVENKVTNVPNRDLDELLRRGEVAYLGDSKSYRRREDSPGLGPPISLIIEQKWSPVRDLIDVMYSSVTGAPARRTRLSIKVMHLVSAGAINMQDADAAIELYSLTTRMRQLESDETFLPAVHQYITMADSVARLLKSRWMLWKKAQPHPEAEDNPTE